MRVLTWWLKILLLIFSIAQLSNAASSCGTPDAITAISQAELIFSGKIVQVQAPEGSFDAGYIVRFKPDGWWKGVPTNEVKLVWKPTLLGCTYLPVGEVGENYLVYADVVTTEELPEVTIFGRTSKLPLDLEPPSLKVDGGFYGPHVSADPALNRQNASNDLAVLRVLKECSCVSSGTLASCPSTSLLAQTLTSNIQTESQSACCKCLRRLRFF